MAGLREDAGRSLTVIHADGIAPDTGYAYIILDGEEFDLIRGEEGFYVTVENCRAETSDVKVIAVGQDGVVSVYSD